MLRKAMVGSKGTRFLRDCRKANRAVFVWTVNDENWMLWSIKQGFDGVITDDPKKYLEVCKDYDEDAPLRLRPKDYVSAVWFNFVILIFDFIFRFRYGYMEGRRVEVQGNGQGNGNPKKIDSERGVV
jgi:phosphatidylglycerol phospholipase C